MVVNNRSHHLGANAHPSASTRARKARELASSSALVEYSRWKHQRHPSAFARAIMTYRTYDDVGRETNPIPFIATSAPNAQSPTSRRAQRVSSRARRKMSRCSSTGRAFARASSARRAPGWKLRRIKGDVRTWSRTWRRCWRQRGERMMTKAMSLDVAGGSSTRKSFRCYTREQGRQRHRHHRRACH